MNTDRVDLAQFDPEDLAKVGLPATFTQQEGHICFCRCANSLGPHVCETCGKPFHNAAAYRSRLPEDPER